MTTKGGDPAGVNPQAMYESLKSKIAALEEELNHAGEEETKFGMSSCVLDFAFLLFSRCPSGFASFFSERVDWMDKKNG